MYVYNHTIQKARKINFKMNCIFENICVKLKVTAYMERSFGNPLLKSATYTLDFFKGVKCAIKRCDLHLARLYPFPPPHQSAQRRGWSTQPSRFSLYDYFYFLKAGLVAAEKNRAAVVLVSMIAGGPGLGFWELGKYILRCSLIHGLTLIDIHGTELNCLLTII